MAVINASSFLLLKDTTVIGHSKNTNISINLDLPDATNKDSLGWQEVITGVRSGSISCECLTDYSDALNFEQIAEMIITKQKAVFYFKQPTNTRLVLRGEGYISSVDETAEFETATSFNLEINLTGIFTISDITEGKTWESVIRQWENISDQWQDV
tara:strand:+ start:607 stop:1074 length:468 start_codon:yes stop_codon:yes gene_type:complete